MKRAKQGQSFFDKVTQFTGSFENALQAAILNGKSITADVSIGEEFINAPVTSKRITSFFNETNEPATAINMEQLATVENEGIGAMIIESTFIVR